MKTNKELTNYQVETLLEISNGEGGSPPVTSPKWHEFHELVKHKMVKETESSDSKVKVRFTLGITKKGLKALNNAR